MPYSVQSPDGSIYGPVDLEGLKLWVREGRLTPDTIVRDETAGTHLPARFMPELAPLFAAPIFTEAASSFGQSAPVGSEPKCFHCGLVLVMGTTVCPRCGIHLYPMLTRRLTGIGFLDGCLGILTVLVLCMVTSGIVALRIPFLSGLLSLMPIIAPIALYVSLRNTYRSYSNGLLAGCFVVPLVLCIALVAGLALLVDTFATAARGWKCSF